MHKKLVLVLVGFLFASSYSLALAQVIINEFVSHPNTGEKEWVELLNTSGSPVDLSGWKLTELSSPGTNPTENDFLSLSGTINDILVFEIGSSKLNDTGDSIGLYDGESQVSRVTFGTESAVINYPINLTAPATGKSGALISNSWEINQEPTKNTQNPNSQPAPVDDSGDEENDSPSSVSSSSGSDVEIKKPTQKIKVLITAKTVAYVNIPFAFSGTGTDVFGDRLSHGRYYWNFGDGDSREVKVMNEDKFLHTYFYSGEYDVVLEYYPDAFAETPEASQKINIKVITPEVLISRVGDEKDFFVELQNNTNYATDISNWTLLSDQRVFKIPRNTILQAKKKIIFSPRLTGFSILDKSTLHLVTSEGDIQPLNFTDVGRPKTGRPTSGTGTAPKVTLIPEDLLALPLVTENKNSNNSFPIIPFIFLLFIGSCAGAVYFIRQRKTPSNQTDDFEILDE